MKTKYRIKNKFRFILFMTASLLLFSFMIAPAFGFNKTDSMMNANLIEVEIKHGDTLWEISRSTCTTNLDTRKVVHKICQLNNITADSIQPGQKIRIPEFL